MITPVEAAKALGIEITTLNVVLGVVLGALLAFIPQTVNWIYDAHQRRKERRLIAKREVLLKAAEGAAYVADVIASYFSNRTNWTDALKVAPGWMHKVHAVGTDATVKAFMDAHDCATEAIADLELLTYRIGQKRQEHDNLTDWRDRLDEFSKKLEDPAYLPMLPDRQKTKHDIMNKIMSSFGQQSTISDERKKLERELMRRAIEWAGKYDTFVTAAMMQVRRELTFGEPSKEYRATLEASSKRAHSALERVMAEVLKEDEDEASSTSATVLSPDAAEAVQTSAETAVPKASSV